MLVLLLFTLVGTAPLLTGCQSESSDDDLPLYEDEADHRVLLNIGVTNETDQRAPDDSLAIQAPDHELWYPEVEHGGVSREFSEYPVGEEYTITLYPTGTDGETLEVPFEMKPTMTSGVASSKTYIEVHDDSIVVRGPAIPDEHMTFER